MYYTRFDTDLCEIILAGDENGISNLHLNTGLGKRVFEIGADWMRNDGFFKDAVKQIDEYFNGSRKTFKLKLNPAGTEYQKKIWKELLKVGFGETASYREIAERTGNKNSSRAVGMANSKNPIPLIVPCHRIIGTNGNLTGFAHGLEIKKKLLMLEKDVHTELNN